MCIEIVVDGTRLLTMGDIRTAIGDVPVADGYRIPIPDGTCLCPVDVDALVKSGRFTREESEDPSVIRLRSIQQENER